jgi:hypothetical protein
MDRVEADLTSGEEWQQSLIATCNRLSTQYLNLLRAASSLTALEKGQQNPRGTLLLWLCVFLRRCSTRQQTCSYQPLFSWWWSHEITQRPSTSPVGIRCCHELLAMSTSGGKLVCSGIQPAFPDSDVEIEFIADG